MTATLDKRDDNIAGKNVYEIFNYQIAYEIRLQQAMEEDLLCPFHYFGITDLSIIGDNEECNRDFSMLTSDERVSILLRSRLLWLQWRESKGAYFLQYFKVKEGHLELNE